MRTLIMVMVLALGIPALAQLPDVKLTPGAVRTVDAKEICNSKFRTGPYRNTTSATKHKVCAEYGFKPGQCPKEGVMEIDHLIPLELGGLDDIKDLWPQLAEYPDGSMGYHDKDKLENELKRQVCQAHTMTLTEAQTCIRANWIQCYARVIGKGK